MSHNMREPTGLDEPVIRPSARKHGISDERICHVVRSCPHPLFHPDDSGRVIFLGPDQHGVPLEVVAFEADSGELTIIHAMKLRPGYRQTYEEVMRWV